MSLVRKKERHCKMDVYERHYEPLGSIERCILLSLSFLVYHISNNGCDQNHDHCGDNSIDPHWHSEPSDSGLTVLHFVDRTLELTNWEFLMEYPWWRRRASQVRNNGGGVIRESGGSIGYDGDIRRCRATQDCTRHSEIGTTRSNLIVRKCDVVAEVDSTRPRDIDGTSILNTPVRERPKES